MKKRPIWQRLNTALLLLILLLLASVGLAIWVADARLRNAQRSEQLSVLKGRIRYDVVLISDAVRGLMLDPKNEAEQKQKREAEEDLKASLDSIPSAFTNHFALMTTVRNLRDFVSGTLDSFNGEVLAAAESGSTGAILLYNRDYPEIRNQRRKLLAELGDEIASVQKEESARAETLALVGFTPLAITATGHSDRRPHSFLQRCPTAESFGRQSRTNAAG